MNSNSMYPTLGIGDIVTVDEDYYSNNSPARWEIIAFQSPVDPSETFIMRIVGLPREIILIKEEGLHINGRKQRSPLSDFDYGVSTMRKPYHGYFQPFVVPKDCYFLLGDNVELAFDSRYWGALPFGRIVGRVESSN